MTQLYNQLKTGNPPPGDILHVYPVRVSIVQIMYGENLKQIPRPTGQILTPKVQDRHLPRANTLDKQFCGVAM